MDKSEIIERLKNIAGHAIHTVGEKPFVMSIDDGVAVHEAIELLEKQEPLTDYEQRIFLAAMGKERAVCKKLTDEWNGMKLDVPCPVNLLRLCAEVERKVKAALWTN